MKWLPIGNEIGKYSPIKISDKTRFSLNLSGSEAPRLCNDFIEHQIWCIMSISYTYVRKMQYVCTCPILDKTIVLSVSILFCHKLGLGVHLFYVTCVCRSLICATSDLYVYVVILIFSRPFVQINHFPCRG